MSDRSRSSRGYSRSRNKNRATSRMSWPYPKSDKFRPAAAGSTGRGDDGKDPSTFLFPGFDSKSFPLCNHSRTSTQLCQRILLKPLNLQERDYNSKAFYNLVVLFRLLHFYRALEPTGAFWDCVGADWGPAVQGDCLGTLVQYYEDARRNSCHQGRIEGSLALLALLVDNWISRPKIDVKASPEYSDPHAVKAYQNMVRQAWKRLRAEELQELLLSKDSRWPVPPPFSRTAAPLYGGNHQRESALRHPIPHGSPITTTGLKILGPPPPPRFERVFTVDTINGQELLAHGVLSRQREPGRLDRPSELEVLEYRPVPGYIKPENEGRWSNGRISPSQLNPERALVPVKRSMRETDFIDPQPKRHHYERLPEDRPVLRVENYPNATMPHEAYRASAPTVVFNSQDPDRRGENIASHSVLGHGATGLEGGFPPGPPGLPLRPPLTNQAAAPNSPRPDAMRLSIRLLTDQQHEMEKKVKGLERGARYHSDSVANQMKDMEKRLECLEGGFKNHEDVVQRNFDDIQTGAVGEVDTVRCQLSTFDKRIESLEKSATDHNGLKNQLHDIFSRLRSLEKGTKDQASTLKGHGERLKRHSDKIIPLLDMDKRLKGLEKGAGDHAGAPQWQEEALKRCESMMKNHTAALAEHGTAINELRTSVKGHASITKMQTELIQRQGRILREQGELAERQRKPQPVEGDQTLTTSKDESVKAG